MNFWQYVVDKLKQAREGEPVWLTWGDERLCIRALTREQAKRMPAGDFVYVHRGRLRCGQLGERRDVFVDECGRYVRPKAVLAQVVSRHRNEAA